MTDYLHIKFESKDYPENLAQDLKVFVQNKGSGNIPQNILQHFRIITDTTENYTIIKPFVGSASFRSLYANKKKRKYIVLMLTEIVHWLERYTNKISILFYFADTKESSLRKKVIYDISNFLNSEKLPFNCEFILCTEQKNEEKLQSLIENKFHEM